MARRRLREPFTTVTFINIPFFEPASKLETMEEKWKALAETLHRSTSQQLRDFSPDIEHAEARHKIALQHWERVKGLVRTSGFTDELEETFFFSAIKPQFTGQLEYFMLLYQYRLFCPVGIPADDLQQHEIEKIERFRSVHASFLAFYRSRRKDPILSQEYFLRRTFNAERRIYPRPFDVNPAFFTNGDWIAAQFIGDLRYHRFLLQEKRQPRPPTEH
jgi:hypothetical protein